MLQGTQDTIKATDMVSQNHDQQTKSAAGQRQMALQHKCAEMEQKRKKSLRVLGATLDTVLGVLGALLDAVSSVLNGTLGILVGVLGLVAKVLHVKSGQGRGDR